MEEDKLDRLQCKESQKRREEWIEISLETCFYAEAKVLRLWNLEIHMMCLNYILFLHFIEV